VHRDIADLESHARRAHVASMARRVIKDTPPRLDVIFPFYDTPIYFVTFNTWQRAPVLACSEIHERFREYAHANAARGRCIGRYVIMPDHVHFFARLGREDRFCDFVRLLKQHAGKGLSPRSASGRHWQPGFFDHLMRSGESYGEKWAYVRENRIRAGLVSRAEDWPFQGEIVRLEL
jgi:putative transposase